MLALGCLGNSRHCMRAGDASLKPVFMLPPPLPLLCGAVITGWQRLCSGRTGPEPPLSWHIPIPLSSNFLCLSVSLSQCLQLLPNSLIFSSLCILCCFDQLLGACFVQPTMPSRAPNLYPGVMPFRASSLTGSTVSLSAAGWVKGRALSHPACVDWAPLPLFLWASVSPEMQ